MLVTLIGNDLFDTWEERQLLGSIKMCVLFYKRFVVIYLVRIRFLAFHLKHSPSYGILNIYHRRSTRSGIAKSLCFQHVLEN